MSFLFFTASEGEVGPAEGAEEDDEGGLDGVDDEGEEDGGLLGDAIEDEHGLDGEVPGAGSVGGGNEDGKASCAEDEEACHGADVAGGIEGEEGEVEMEVVAYPDADAIEQIEREIADSTEGDESVEEALHAVVDGLENGEASPDEGEEGEGEEAAEDGDPPAGGGEASDDGCGIETGLAEELEEHGELAQESDEGDEEHEGGIDDAFGDDGSEGFCKGNSSVLLQCATAGDLANAGNDEAGGVAEEDAVGTEARGGLFAHREEGHAPTEGTENEGYDAKGEGDGHPQPIDVIDDTIEDFVPVCAAIHPPQDANCEGKRQKYVEIFKELFHCL